MAAVRIPIVVALRFIVTSTTLTNFFSPDYLDTSVYSIRAPYHNERIVLPVPSPADFMDPERDHSLIFYVKQRDFGLTSPFSPFFIEVFVTL